MSRPVALRTSWRNDAAWLLRFEEAVEKDRVQSPEWRRAVCEKTRELYQMLLTAKRPIQAEEQPSSRRRTA